jgi:late competence protein required for DNA uptake (superfamily II DNA/RNA helicase)
MNGIAKRLENRACQRQRIWCDRCHEDLPTWKFESMDARLALWFCDNCYEIMTGEAT